MMLSLVLTTDSIDFEFIYTMLCWLTFRDPQTLEPELQHIALRTELITGTYIISFGRVTSNSITRGMPSEEERKRGRNREEETVYKYA